jgi:BASS family bile acid:Na+ symporter
VIFDLLIPAIVVLLMVSAGTGVRLQQFACVVRLPRLLIGGTLAQLLLLPLLALLLVWLTAPPPALAAGLVLVAACPGGALSNFYCYLGRLDVSLSVVLTALSSLLAFATLPAVLAVAFPALDPVARPPLPVAEMALRLALYLLLPVAIGMAIRQYAPEQVERHGRRLRTAGLVLLVILVGMILFDQWETVVATYRSALVLGGLFTVTAFAVGWVVGAVLGGGRDGRRVLAVEFAVRNLGAAALIASTTLGRPDFLAFGAVFVMVQLPLVFWLLRNWRQATPAPAT